MSKLAIILDYYPEEEFLLADGFDDCVIGVYYDKLNSVHKLVYSTTKCLNKLIEDGMSELDAREYFDYNVEGAYIGTKTPIWVDDIMFD